MVAFDLSLMPVEVQCPYCWETFEVVIDPSVDKQTYTEDCFVCCQPIEFHVVTSEAGVVSIDVVREND
ncbi:CPXCG motif-containing cysteine-rich protein [Thiomicrorhabdus indica]|uniref:CPXCG motif-containing cysteine-rich protein n=1 Tax=Thiomicrorhabdus indica TaxID=2267253 RepID=UPI00102DF4FB|nr:CPXCG motif-containing cysteine-rich protein [Thiomicrorhabdus indica]